MAIQKTEAFVIKTQPFRSSSLIITFYSKDFGKLKGIVKGVRKEREMRGAMYEIFTHLEIIFYEKSRSDLYLISDAAIIDSHDVLRTRLDTISYASYFSELVNVLTELYDPHPEIFDLMDVIFRYLPLIDSAKLILLFEVCFLNELGLLPKNLSMASELSRSIYFSVSQGKVLSDNQRKDFPDAVSVSRAALELLDYFGTHSLEQSIKHRVGAQTEKELAKLIHNFLEYQTGIPLKTSQFLKQLTNIL
jgi:DNA repair protein RecO (recombination protein O)